MNDALGAAWSAIVGQPDAVAVLQTAATNPLHAYLLTGPAGSGKRAAARAFAATVVSPVGGGDTRSARLAGSGEHPDVVEVERVGASILKPQALEIVRVAALSPVEGRRKVLILAEFHLLSAEGAAVLLKTIEEPAASTVIVILADQMPPELITIASRCVRVEFRPLTDEVVRAALIDEGVDEDSAERAAAAASGNLERARLLAADPGLEARRTAFASLSHRLNGTGNTAVGLTRSLLELIEAAADPLKARQSADVARLEAQVAQTGERGSGRKTLEERHKRELRRHRADELRAGLTEIGRTYRDALVAGTAVGVADNRVTPASQVAQTGKIVDAVSTIHGAIEAIDRNPNESLLLQALLLRLPRL